MLYPTLKLKLRLDLTLIPTYQPILNITHKLKLSLIRKLNFRLTHKLVLIPTPKFRLTLTLRLTFKPNPILNLIILKRKLSESNLSSEIHLRYVQHQ